jgi:hypothetical protein
MVLVMSTAEKARQLMAKDRQHDHLIEENMLERAAESSTEGETDAIARELLAKERLENELLQEQMLERAVEQIN